MESSVTVPWRVDHLRFTVFKDLGPPEPEKGWATVLSTPPDTVTNNLKQLQLTQAGTFETGQLQVVQSATRVDILWNAPVIGAELRDGLGRLDVALEKFAQIIEKFLREFAPSVGYDRIAQGALLHAPAESREDGYRILDGLLPSVNLDPGSQDFTYTINRPRDSKVVSDLRINRLSKWLCAMWHQSVASGGTVNPIGNPIFTCTLETDISTAHTASEKVRGLSVDELCALWQEFARLNVELAEKGDVP